MLSCLPWCWGYISQSAQHHHCLAMLSAWRFVVISPCFILFKIHQRPVEITIRALTYMSLCQSTFWFHWIFFPFEVWTQDNTSFHSLILSSLLLLISNSADSRFQMEVWQSIRRTLTENCSYYKWIIASPASWAAHKCRSSRSVMMSCDPCESVALWVRDEPSSFASKIVTQCIFPFIFSKRLITNAISVKQCWLSNYLMHESQANNEESVSALILDCYECQTL